MGDAGAGRKIARRAIVPLVRERICLVPSRNAGDERIDGERAPRRNVASEQRDREQHERHPDKCPRIDCADSKKQAHEQARKYCGERESHHQANNREAHSLSRDEPQHVAFLCSERATNADFVSLLIHGVRQYAVHADRRENQREAAEERE